MNDKNGFEKYVSSMLWAFAIDNLTYDSDYLIFNNLERFLTICFLIVASALTAIVFGMVASKSKIFPEKYDAMYNKISKIQSVMETSSDIPTKIKQKVESYFQHIAETKNKNSSLIDSLSEILPKQLVIFI